MWDGLVQIATYTGAPSGVTIRNQLRLKLDSFETKLAAIDASVKAIDASVNALSNTLAPKLEAFRTEAHNDSRASLTVLQTVQAFLELFKAQAHDDSINHANITDTHTPALLHLQQHNELLQKAMGLNGTNRDFFGDILGFFTGAVEDVELAGIMAEIATAIGLIPGKSDVSKAADDAADRVVDYFRKTM